MNGVIVHERSRPVPVAHHSVAVIGGGQAGLSISWYLAQSGIDHVVFEKERAGHAWRAERWDTFCLVTPNWQCQLPGFPYQGADPHGFMLRDEIVAYFDAFVASFDPPLREGVAVQAVCAAMPSTASRSMTSGRHSLRRPGGDRGRRLSDPGDPALRRAAAGRHRADQLRAIPQSGSRCPKARCWWSAAANRAARSPRTCISPAARFISASATRRGWRGAIAARTWSSGCT